MGLWATGMKRCEKSSIRIEDCPELAMIAKTIEKKLGCTCTTTNHSLRIHLKEIDVTYRDVFIDLKQTVDNINDNIKYFLSRVISDFDITQDEKIILKKIIHILTNI